MAANKPLLADVLAVMHGKRGKLISETHGNANSTNTKRVESVALRSSGILYVSSPLTLTIKTTDATLFPMSPSDTKKYYSTSYINALHFQDDTLHWIHVANCK